MRFARGFTLWELLVVVALVTILFLAAIENLLPLRAEAERASVVAVVGSLNSALGMESIQRAMARDPAALARMDGANPMEWLAVAPSNYAGALANTSAVPPGHWSYDAGSGIVFYRVRYPQYFKGSFMQPPGLRFRVTVGHGDGGRLDHVKLESLDAGEWITKGSEIARWLGETP